MQELIVFILGSVGMTHIIIDGAIFNSVRAFLRLHIPSYLHNLFECYMCCGFWCGVFLSYFLLSKNFFFIFSCGCLCSLLSHFHATLLNLLETLSIKNLNE
jgi:hypothetical protein